jgi:hypothetical protein
MTKTVPSKFNSTDKFSGLKIAEGQEIVLFAAEWVAATPFTLALAGREAEYVETLKSMSADELRISRLTNDLQIRNIAPAKHMGIIRNSLTAFVHENGTYSTPIAYAALTQMGITVFPNFMVVKPHGVGFAYRVYLDESGQPTTAEQLPAWTAQETTIENLPPHIFHTIAITVPVTAEPTVAAEIIANEPAAEIDEAPVAIEPEIETLIVEGKQTEFMWADKLAKKTWGDGLSVFIGSGQKLGQPDSDYGDPIACIIHKLGLFKKEYYNVYQKI